MDIEDNSVGQIWQTFLSPTGFPQVIEQGLFQD
jgi:hypothetical protein